VCPVLIGGCIHGQVLDVCKGANPRLDVWRARFSAVIPREINRAMANLVRPNKPESDAVDARQEIDLRIGAAFTRWQTQTLQVHPHPLTWKSKGSSKCTGRAPTCPMVTLV
jgi:DNA topoisomerase IA